EGSLAHPRPPRLRDDERGRGRRGGLDAPGEAGRRLHDPDRDHAPRDVPRARERARRGGPLVRAVDLLQPGRVPGAPAGPPGELPRLHAGELLRPRGHRARENPRPGRLRRGPRGRVRAVRARDPGGRRGGPVRARDWTQRPHRVQRARRVLRLPHPGGQARRDHAPRQRHGLRRGPGA
ncbi:MAG: Glucosamine-6-phosphate deaminase, partial [uncultured Rubrobacteraceae bacterium]